MTQRQPPDTRVPKGAPQRHGPSNGAPQSPDQKRRQHQEDLLDEAVEETFPASDPISPKKIT